MSNLKVKFPIMLLVLFILSACTSKTAVCLIFFGDTDNALVD